MSPSPAAPAAVSEPAPAPAPLTKEQRQQRKFLRGALESNPLFRRLDSKEHRDQLISAFTRARYGRGELLVRYGERGDRFFVLQDGECAIELPSTEVQIAPEHRRDAAENGDATAASAAASSAGAVSIAAESSTAAAAAAASPVATLQVDEGVRVDLLQGGRSFGEVSLLYDTRRCASVRCVSDECVAWSVDAATFREHAKSGALLLRSIFQQFASVRVKDPDSSAPPPPVPPAGSRLPVLDASHPAPPLPDPEHLLMTLPDFMEAIEYSKGLSMWNEAKRPSAEAAAEGDDEEDDEEDVEEERAAARDHHYFRNKLAKLLHQRKREAQKLAAADAERRAARNPLGELTPARLRLIFRLADSSGDNLLSFGEFLILHSLLSQPHSEMQLVFRLFDRDKNGTIERNEFVAALKALAADGSEEGEKGTRATHGVHPETDWDNDPLVQELFGPPVRRRRSEVEAELAAERALRAREQQQTNGAGAFSWVRSAYSSSKEWLLHGVFHQQRALVEPTPPPSQSETGALDDSDEYVLQYRALTYERFSHLLKRQELPAVLSNVKSDFRAIDRFWRGGDAPFSLSAMESGFGASINLESLKQQSEALLPTVTSAHVADSERMLRSIPWRNLLAGGIAGAVSRSIVAPIERLKMLYQLDSEYGRGSNGGGSERGKNGKGVTMEGTSSFRRYRGGLGRGLRQMYAEDGARGFWKGNGANVLRVVPLLALQFACYDIFKRHMFGPWHNDQSVLQRLVAGASAGMTACLLTYPLDTVRARLTLQRGEGTGLLSLFSQIYRTEGVRGYYHGLVPSLAGVIPYVGLDFAVYETLKQCLPRDEHDECSRLHLFVCGAFAGVVGQTIAYPLDLVRRRMQVYGWAGSGDLHYTHNYHRGTFLDALRIIRAEDGYRGLYRGIGINYVKVVPAVSVAFMVYERVLSALGTGNV